MQIELDTAVDAAHSLKEVALQAATELQATWVILDRSATNNLYHFITPQWICQYVCMYIVFCQNL